MANNIERRSPFDCPIFEFDLEGFGEYQAQIIHAIQEERANASGVNRSNQGGWHSASTLYKHKDPSLVWLTDQLYKMSCLSLAKEQGSQAQQAVMSACWANVNEFGDWNAPHAHIPAILAGVCYISVPENNSERSDASGDGDIIFINPVAYGAQYNRPPITSYAPKEGKVFIFPGFLLHMVAPHFSSGARISVSFNIRLSSDDSSAR